MDISSSLVAGLRAGTHRSDEPGVAEGLTRSAEWLRPIERLTEAVAAAETVFVCVDTPSTGGEQHYDHTKLGCVLTQLGAIQVGPRPLHVVICCTVLPGSSQQSVSWPGILPAFVLKRCNAIPLKRDMRGGLPAPKWLPTHPESVDSRCSCFSRGI